MKGANLSEKERKELEEKLVGKTIKIIEMVGEPQYAGKIGTVSYIDDASQLHGDWGGAALLVGVDTYEVLN